MKSVARSDQAYRKVLEFQTAPANLLCAYEVKLPEFERGKILENDAGDGMLRVAIGDKSIDYRIEKDGTGGWLFFGGILLDGRR